MAEIAPTRRSDLKRLRGPFLDRQPGWEISFGGTGDRSRFLIEVIRAVPDGSTLDIDDLIDPSVLDRLEPFITYWRPKGWFRSAVLGLVVDSNSRDALAAVIGEIDFTKQWCAVRLFKNEAEYLDSHDLMYDSGPFIIDVADGVSVDTLAHLKESGIITEYERFDPTG